MISHIIIGITFSWFGCDGDGCGNFGGVSDHQVQQRAATWCDVARTSLWVAKHPGYSDCR